MGRGDSAFGRASFYQQKVLHVAGFLAVRSRPMEELTPEIRHWSAVHPNIGWVVSSYWLPGIGVLLDPLEVPDEVEGVAEIVLSNRHHRRSAFEARERFGAVVRVPAWACTSSRATRSSPTTSASRSSAGRSRPPGDGAVAGRRRAAHPLARGARDRGHRPVERRSAAVHARRVLRRSSRPSSGASARVWPRLAESSTSGTCCWPTAARCRIRGRERLREFAAA